MGVSLGVPGGAAVAAALCKDIPAQGSWAARAAQLMGMPPAILGNYMTNSLILPLAVSSSPRWNKGAQTIPSLC